MALTLLAQRPVERRHRWLLEADLSRSNASSCKHAGAAAAAAAVSHTWSGATRGDTPWPSSEGTDEKSPDCIKAEAFIHTLMGIGSIPWIIPGKDR